MHRSGARYRSATSCVPHNGRLLRASRTTVRLRPSRTFLWSGRSVDRLRSGLLRCAVCAGANGWQAVRAAHRAVAECRGAAGRGRPLLDLCAQGSDVHAGPQRDEPAAYTRKMLMNSPSTALPVVGAQQLAPVRAAEGWPRHASQHRRLQVREHIQGGDAYGLFRVGPHQYNEVSRARPPACPHCDARSDHSHHEHRKRSPKKAPSPRPSPPPATVSRTPPARSPFPDSARPAINSANGTLDIGGVT